MHGFVWNEDMAIFVQHMGESVTHHLVAIVIITILSVVGAWLIRLWRDWRYGVFIRIVSAWVEPATAQSPVALFHSKVLWQGRALDLFHQHTVTRAFVRAYRKTAGGLLDQRCWKPQVAKETLQIVDNQISMQFAAGSLAKAMEDKDVTRGEFYLGAFRVRGGAMLLLMRREDILRYRHLPPPRESTEESDCAHRMTLCDLLQSGNCFDQMVLYM